MSRQKYGLQVGHYKRHVRWAVDNLDQEFLGKLTDTEREWLRRFNKEFYDDQFEQDHRKHLHKKRLLPEAEWRFNARSNQYIPTTQRQDCTHRKNQRNRHDDFAYHQLGKQHVALNEELDDEGDLQADLDVEDRLIDAIDRSRSP